MHRVRVLLADDHVLVMNGLKALLEPEFDVVGTVQDGRALVESAQKLVPEVVVTDIAMPRLNGLEAVRQIKKLGLNTKIIFVTMHLDADLATQAIRIGADGYLLKNCAPDELRVAIGEALDGGIYVTPLIGNDVLQAITKKPLESDGFEVLTTRQREVLQLLAEGHTAKEIATLLNVSKTTVEFHKVRLKQALGVDSIAELTQYALRLGIVAPGARPKGTRLKVDNLI